MSRPLTIVDYRVGQRIRERRIEMGWTQADLGERIGVTYLTCHRYESAIARISAGTLVLLASALCVPVSYFFQEPKMLPKGEERQIMALVKNFRAIRNPEHRDGIFKFIHEMILEDAA